MALDNRGGRFGSLPRQGMKFTGSPGARHRRLREHSSEYFPQARQGRPPGQRPPGVPTSSTGLPDVSGIAF
jgi:hypothetical protein